MNRGALTHHDVRTCVGTEYDADGILGVQCEPDGKNGDCPNVELHVPMGLVIRPLDPDEAGPGALFHTYYEGSRQHAVPSYDARILLKLPKFPKGTMGIAGYGGRYAVFLPDGTLQAYVPELNADGSVKKAHVIEMKPGGACTMRHGDGAGFVLSSDGATLHSPDGSSFFQAKKNGDLVANGNLKVTGAFQFGGAAGVVPIIVGPSGPGAPSTMGKGV